MLPIRYHNLQNKIQIKVTQTIKLLKTKITVIAKLIIKINKKNKLFNCLNRRVNNNSPKYNIVYNNHNYNNPNSNKVNNNNNSKSIIR